MSADITVADLDRSQDLIDQVIELVTPMIDGINKARLLMREANSLDPSPYKLGWIATFDDMRSHLAARPCSAMREAGVTR